MVLPSLFASMNKLEMEKEKAQPWRKGKKQQKQWIGVVAKAED